MAETKDAPGNERVAIHLSDTRAQFHVRADGALPVIEVDGEVDVSNADALAGCLSVFDEGETVIVDMTRLGFIDSQGIATLAQACTRPLHIVCRGAHGAVRRTLELCGLESILTIED